MKKLIVLSGPPGSGKGTQAELLCQRTGFVHFSTGDRFRYEIAEQTEIGKIAESYLKQGILVPDQTVLDLTNKFIHNNQTKGIVFDGFPRTRHQAEGLDNILNNINKTVDCAIFIELSLSEIIKRLAERRICRQCGAIYNLSFKPPKKDEICDSCQGELYQREDDKETTIRKRYEVYERQTQELIKYYQDQNKLFLISGTIGKALVHEQIAQIVYENLPPSPTNNFPS